MRSTLCFYMGYSPSFNGQNYGTKKVFGSEITTIKLAESLVDLYNVYIFVSGLANEEEIIYNNVHYLNKDKLHTFEKIDIMIIVRYINYFIYFKNIAKKTFIWLHDVTVQPSYKGLILQNNGDELLYNLQHCYNKLVVLSNYHFNNNFNYIGISSNKYTIIPNIIDNSYYNPRIQKIKNRFIYTSDIRRGFDILLDCLIYMQKFISDISLVVFRSHEFTDTIRTKLKLLNNVTIYGKEKREILANEYLQAEYFFYPTNFCETFCNCAAEAQLYHCVCIYNNIGSLNTTISDRGLQINYDINDIDYVEKTCNDVMNLMKNKQKKVDYIVRGHQYAKLLDIKNVKNKWLELFEEE